MDAKFFVPYETAKLLKEKGFPQEIDKIFFDGRIVTRNIGIKHMDTLNIVAAPTYHEVLDWLESKEIYVSVSIDLNFHKREMEYNGYITSYAGEWSSEEFTSREEALNAAILKALELI